MENQFNSQQPQQPVPPQGYPQQPGQPPTQCPNAPWILGIVGFCLMLLGLIILKILQTGVYAQLYPQDFFSRLSRSVEPPSSIWLFYYKFIIFTIYLHLFGGLASLVLSFFGNTKSNLLFGQIMVALGAAIGVTSIPTINILGLPAGILFLAGGINMVRFAKSRR